MVFISGVRERERERERRLELGNWMRWDLRKERRPFIVVVVCVWLCGMIDISCYSSGSCDKVGWGIEVDKGCRLHA